MPHSDTGGRVVGSGLQVLMQGWYNYRLLYRALANVTHQRSPLEHAQRKRELIIILTRASTVLYSAGLYISNLYCTVLAIVKSSLQQGVCIFF